MRPEDKAAVERVIMNIEPVIEAAIIGSSASARAPGGGVIILERLRVLIEEAVNRYYAETPESAGPSPVSKWSRKGTGWRGNWWG